MAPPRSSALLLALLATAAAATYIDNMVPRRDVDGVILDSHDFSLHKYPGREGYWMFSVAYGGCLEPANQGCDQTADHCGFQMNHTVNVWSSPDLSSGSWVKVAEAISPAQRPAGTVYRPKAVWNPKTSEVVAWHNYVHPSGEYAGYAAYTAPRIEGPYALQRLVVNVTVQNATEQCGDYDLFVDPADGTGYAIMGCGFHMWIERLAPNMLDSAGDTSPTGRFLFSEYFIEAPALFVRNGIYYAVFDSCAYEGGNAPAPEATFSPSSPAAEPPAPNPHRLLLLLPGQRRRRAHGAAPARPVDAAGRGGLRALARGGGGAGAAALVARADAARRRGPRRAAHARAGLPVRGREDDLGHACSAERHLPRRPRGRHAGVDLGRRQVAAELGRYERARSAGVGAALLQRGRLHQPAEMDR